MENSQATAELKNCKINNTSHLFRLLAQCLGSDKWQFWALASSILWSHPPGRGKNLLIYLKHNQNKDHDNIRSSKCTPWPAFSSQGLLIYIINQCHQHAEKTGTE